MKTPRRLLTAVRKARIASKQQGRGMYVWVTSYRCGFRAEAAKASGRMYVFLVAAEHVERLCR